MRGRATVTSEQREVTSVPTGQPPPCPASHALRDWFPRFLTKLQCSLSTWPALGGRCPLRTNAGEQPSGRDEQRAPSARGRHPVCR